MDLKNTLRGHMAQSLVALLFEHGGFRVTRLGIEDLFQEIKLLDQSQYLALKLPKNLRSLPDLLVADREMKTAKLVEVKYRSKWNEETIRELQATLKKQRIHWPGSMAVIIRGDAEKTLRFHQDYIRVIGSRADDQTQTNLDDHIDYRSKFLPEWSADDIWNHLYTLHTFSRSAEWDKLLSQEGQIIQFIKALAAA